MYGDDGRRREEKRREEKRREGKGREGKGREEAEKRREVWRGNYSARRKISSRLRPGQRIEPVWVGNDTAPLSTPQLSQSRNCSFSPLIITGSHPMPRAYDNA